MQLSVHRQSFDSGHFHSVTRNRERRTGFDGCAIDMHDAGAALTCIAPDVRTGEAKLIAQKVHQECTAFHIAGHCLAIDVHIYGRHLTHLP
jgi:hypothetical protein